MGRHYMTDNVQQKGDSAIEQSGIARVIPCKSLTNFACSKWISRGIQDFKQAIGISVFYGLIFTILPLFIYYLVQTTGWYLVIFPAMVSFMLIGPFLAAGLYHVAWQINKNNQPTFKRSLTAMSRNAVNEWGFGIMLMIFMIFWLRVASIIHALYPEYVENTIWNLLPFLMVGTIVGIIFTTIVFFLTAFTQPILLHRKVDLATAVLTSINAVWRNKLPMFIWAMVISFSVLLGFLTFFFAFIVIMPIIAYASWHGYIDTIETRKKQRLG